ncbi:alpha-2,8-sialyltransferase 8F-like [Ambystoma mexicanum]|uniref:alpha-2,8-sialyltransferase 8F-like n=1 Tax=Ambystoma mexicanum TaxID=8296 RepID=UPI0037E7ECCB
MRPLKGFAALLLLGSAALAIFYVQHAGTRAGGTRESSPESRTARPFVVPENVNIGACIKVKSLLHGNSLKKLQTKELLTKVFDLNSCPWIGNRNNLQHYRNELARCCNASYQLIVTQENSPVGHTVSYETDAKKNVMVTDEMFQLFVETSPFKNKQYKTCSVVGNGGILLGSFCGENIDQADFVFRSNLPPLNYTDDVGTKVDLVTANPSLIVNRFENLNNRRKSFGTFMQAYKNAYILVPAFSYPSNTEIAFKVHYTLEDFGLNQTMLYYHPDYMKKLAIYWKAAGVEAARLSSGFMMVNAALELCDKVTLYGFWPFDEDLHQNPILHHYYDDVRPKPDMHKMSDEFFFYLQMHNQGVLQIQMDNCF